MSSYFIFAGEASGDLHGSKLIEALKEKHKDIYFEGVGGPRMRLCGLRAFLNMEDFEVMGFSDVLKSLPKLYHQFYKILDYIIASKPDCVILIDYPGFNLRLAKKLREKNFAGKIVQYVCPSVWAHGKERIEQLSSTLNLLLTILPFENEYFTHTNLKTKYIGNPLTQNIQTYHYQENWKKKLDIPGDKTLIALFPGSRRGEIKRNLPLFIETIKLIKENHPESVFGLSYADESLIPFIEEILISYELPFIEDITLVPRCYTYELMRDSYAALAKSGTVTLELALHNCPTVVIYKLTMLNYLFAKYKLKVRLPFYSLPNILAGKQVFPELIGTQISSSLIFSELNKLMSTKTEHQKVKDECEKIKILLGQNNAHTSAAEAIMELFEC